MNDINNLYSILMDKNPSEYFMSLSNDELSEKFPYLHKLKGLEQCKDHHPEGDVFNHVMLVVARAYELKDFTDNPFEFMIAALLHDIGKSETQSFDINGMPHYYHHDCVGADMIEDIDFLKNHKHIKLYVKNMIRLHMRINSLFRNNANVEKGYNKIMKQAYCLNDLNILAECDMLGRGKYVEYYSKRILLRDLMFKYRNSSRFYCIEPNVYVKEPKDGYRVYKRIHRQHNACYIETTDIAKEGQLIKLEKYNNVIKASKNTLLLIDDGKYTVIDRDTFLKLYKLGCITTSAQINDVSKELNIGTNKIKSCKSRFDSKYVYAKILTDGVTVKTKNDVTQKSNRLWFKVININDEDDVYIIPYEEFNRSYDLVY